MDINAPLQRGLSNTAANHCWLLRLSLSNLAASQHVAWSKTIYLYVVRNNMSVYIYIYAPLFFIDVGAL